MSALGHLGRATANGLFALLAYVVVSLLFLDGPDWRGGAGFSVVVAVAVLAVSVWQST